MKCITYESINKCYCFLCCRCFLCVTSFQPRGCSSKQQWQGNEVNTTSPVCNLTCQSAIMFSCFMTEGITAVRKRNILFVVYWEIVIKEEEIRQRKKIWTLLQARCLLVHAIVLHNTTHCGWLACIFHVNLICNWNSFACSTPASTVYHAHQK